MLSKSVGDLSSSDLIGLKNRHEAVTIKYAGYLLKRSNNPWRENNELSSQQQQVHVSASPQSKHHRTTTATSGNHTLSSSPQAQQELPRPERPEVNTRLDLYTWLRNGQQQIPNGSDILIPPQHPSIGIGGGFNFHNNNNNKNGADGGGTTAKLFNSLLSNDNNHSNQINMGTNLRSLNNLAIPELIPNQSLGVADRSPNDLNITNNSNDHVEDAIGLAASFFGQDVSSCYKKTSESIQSQMEMHHQHHIQNLLEDEQSNAHSFTSTNSYPNNNYDDDNILPNPSSSSDSSHIPSIPKSLTQPIAIISTNSDDSEDYYYRYQHNNSPQHFFMEESNYASRNSNNDKSTRLLHSDNVPKPPPAFVRMTSAPAVGSKKSYPPPPPDYIDSKDGHIWRAKYCVLEDGVLYFYATAEIGDSPGAKAERIRMASLDYGGYNNDTQSTIQQNIHLKRESLAKSPMPRRTLMQHKQAMIENSNAESYSQETDVYCEKRVPLSMVNAVKSNPDYGEKIFELSAINSEEEREKNGQPVDKLLLRAGSEHDMNCWIFEIHRSYNFLMKQIAVYLGSVDTSAGNGSSRARLFERGAHSVRKMNEPSYPLTPVVGQTSFYGESPKFGITALSHGHGRSIRRRRLDDGGTSSNSLTLTPKSPGEVTSVEAGKYMSKSLDAPGFLSRALLHNDMSREKMAPADKATASTLSSSPLSENSLESSLTTPMFSPKPQKYIPPQKRNQGQDYFTSSNLDPSIAAALAEEVHLEEEEFMSSSPSNTDLCDDTITNNTHIQPMEIRNVGLGGCADPSLIRGSICDPEYVKVSKVVESADQPFGYTVDNVDIGAASICGIRESNEDSYLIINDLLQGLPLSEDESFFGYFLKRSLFAIFDGHCGNQASRFTAEKLGEILVQVSRDFKRDDAGSNVHDEPMIEDLLKRSISRLDKEFCELCCKDGRDWYSGTTAIIALFLDNRIYVANVGDCRGIFCCSSPLNDNVQERVTMGWQLLDIETSDNYRKNSIESYEENYDIIWKEVAKTHSPSHEEEKLRIKKANGWTENPEKEITMISQYQTIKEHLSDEDVRLIFLRWFSDRCDSKHNRILSIWRVCGDLSVSRAIGDRDYKAAYGKGTYDSWKSAAPFLYPNNHSGSFKGDLIISEPDIKCIEIFGKENVLLLACDGFWDVLDTDEAVRLARKLVFGKGLTARESAQRLTELAKHLGSSDNITVIIVKFEIKNDYCHAQW